jgi:hypothetical protein
VAAVGSVGEALGAAVVGVSDGTTWSKTDQSSGGSHRNGLGKSVMTVRPFRANPVGLSINPVIMGSSALYCAPTPNPVSIVHR